MASTFTVNFKSGQPAPMLAELCICGIPAEDAEGAIVTFKRSMPNHEVTTVCDEHRRNLVVWAADGARPMKVEDIKVGEFVKRKHDAQKVYARGEYDRSTKTYTLHDQDDASRTLEVKKGTMLFVGFTY